MLQKQSQFTFAALVVFRTSEVCDGSGRWFARAVWFARKKAVGEYGQKWEWGKTGETELLLVLAGGGYYIYHTLRNSRGLGPLGAQ